MIGLIGGVESKTHLPILDSLQSAADLVHSVIPPTPQIRWPLLCQRVGAEVWVKHENHHPTGAFKVRGGIVYLEELVRQHPDVKGVVSARRVANQTLATILILRLNNCRERRNPALHRPCGGDSDGQGE